MPPRFENLRIYGDEVVCCLISFNQVSSFKFIYDSNNSLSLSSDFKIYLDGQEHTRRCMLIKNSNKELFIKFKKISLDIDESYICQVFIKSDSFSCISCNKNFTSTSTSPCCAFDNNIIKINSGKIYKMSLLNHETYFKHYSQSREEFKLLHFASVVDTMLLGDPI
jgi:hypothetical protein